MADEETEEKGSFLPGIQSVGAFSQVFIMSYGKQICPVTETGRFLEIPCTID